MSASSSPIRRARESARRSAGIAAASKASTGTAIAPDHARCHPVPKPLELLRELVADFSDPDELVCEPYDGGVTTGIMCAL